MIKRNLFIETSFFSLMMISSLFLYSCGGGGSGSRSEVSGLDTIPPTVSSTSPSSGAINVPQNAKISAIFSEALNGAPSQNAFIVSSAGGVASGTLAYADNTVTFTPSTLEAKAIYSVTITTDIQDGAGNHMASPYTWFFTTGTGIDNSPPSFSGNPWISVSATSSTSIALSWNAATDNTTPSDQLRYQVCRSTSPNVCKTVPFPAAASGVIITDVAGTPNSTVSLDVTGLSSNTTYYFVVRAEDLVDLGDNNTFEASAKTGGAFVSLGTTQNQACTGTGGACNNDAEDPSIAVIGNTLYLAWTEVNGVYFRTLNTVSKNWLNATQIPATLTASAPQTITQRRPHLAQDSAGTLYIAYAECNPDCKILVKKWNGNAWDLVGGGPLNLDQNKSTEYSAIAVSGSGILYATWVEPKTLGQEDGQIYVAHLNGTTWVQDATSQAGGSLNSDTLRAATNPAIAVDGASIKVAWSECPSAGSTLNCDIYLRTLPGSSWSNPASFKAVADNKPDKPSLTFANGVLHLVWYESNKVYSRKEEAGVLTSPIQAGDAAPSSNLSLRSTATAAGSQIPYLVFADNTIATKLFVKRWDNVNNVWVVEGKVSPTSDGSLNMASSGATARTINSSIAFLQGTPYVAWVESGSCNSDAVCGNIDGTHKQLYVKRLE